MLCAKAFAPLPLVARKIQLRKVSVCAKGGNNSEFSDVFGGRQKKFSGEIEIEMPEWNDESDVVVDGNVVYSTSGTLKEYKQEIWSGNHPFYADRGLGTGVVTADTQVKKFTSKYNDMAALSDLDALLESI